LDKQELFSKIFVAGPGMYCVAHPTNQCQLLGCNVDGNLLWRVGVAAPFLLCSKNNQQNGELQCSFLTLGIGAKQLR
jgi:hypothetical protein